MTTPQALQQLHGLTQDVGGLLEMLTRRAVLVLAVVAGGCGAPPTTNSTGTGRVPSTSSTTPSDGPASGDPGSQRETPRDEAADLAAVLEACRDWSPEEVQERPAILCAAEDELVPSQNNSFPAISGSGAEVAVISRAYDGVSDSLETTFEIRGLDNRVAVTWALENRADDGTEGVSPVLARSRIAELNRHLFDGSFRAMVLVAEDQDGVEFPLSLRGGLTASRGSAGLEVRRGNDVAASLDLPSYQRDSDCCDGGLGRGGHCQIPATIIAVWQHEGVVVLSASAVHQRDGCDSSPSFQVLEVSAHL